LIWAKLVSNLLDLWVHVGLLGGFIRGFLLFLFSSGGFLSFDLLKFGFPAASATSGGRLRFNF